MHRCFGKDASQPTPCPIDQILFCFNDCQALKFTLILINSIHWIGLAFYFTSRVHEFQ